MAQTTPQDTRTVAQIRADIAATRARMAAGVEQLVEEVHPAAIKQRTVNDAKDYARSAFASIKTTVTEQVKDDDGWRTDRLVLVGGAVVGVVTFLLTIRAIVARAKKHS